MGEKPKFKRINPFKYKDFIISMCGILIILIWMTYDLIKHKSFLVVGPISIVLSFYLSNSLKRMISDARIPDGDERHEGGADSSGADK